MLTLLDSRTTDTSYPTDAALQQMFQGEGNGSRLLDGLIHASGTFGGATLAIQLSWDGGTTWHDGSYTLTDVGFMTPISMLPGWKIRPVITDAGSTTDISAVLFP